MADAQNPVHRAYDEALAHAIADDGNAAWLKEQDAWDATVTAWIRGCDLAWVTTVSKEAAALLEARLLSAWRPPINVA